MNRKRLCGWDSLFFQECATSIEEPNRQQRADLLERSGRGLHLVKAANTASGGVGSLLDLRAMETRPSLASQAAKCNKAWLRGASNRTIISTCKRRRPRSAQVVSGE